MYCSVIDNYFRHKHDKAPCGIRKLTAAFVSKIGVFSWFSWSLDLGAKMAEFPLPVLQIWRSWKWVAIQIQLMNIHGSECKYYLLFTFGPQIWRCVRSPKLAAAPDWLRGQQISAGSIWHIICFKFCLKKNWMYVALQLPVWLKSLYLGKKVNHVRFFFTLHLQY